MLCHRGCGLPSTYFNKKQQPCCSKSGPSCPAIKNKIGSASGEARRKNPVKRTLEQRKNQSLVVKKQHTDGKRNSPETIEKIRAGNIRTKGQQVIVPWNKGLTKEDPRVAAYANKQKGTQRATRTKIIPSTDPIYQNFKKYRNRIAVRTKKIYNEFKSIINPLNLPLGKAGIDGAHHIDHIMSVKEAFIYSIPIELVSSKENLRVIPWKENNSKYSKVDYTQIPESIKIYMKENKCDT